MKRKNRSCFFAPFFAVLMILSCLITVSADDGELLDGTPFGSDCWEDGADYLKAFDGDTDTCYDAAEFSEDMEVGIALGTRASLTAVQIDPREGCEDRMQGLRIQGSLDGHTWVTLYTLPDTEYDAVTFTVGYDEFDAEIRDHGFLYFRLSNALRQLSAAEVRFYGTESDDEAGEIYRTMPASEFYADYNELYEATEYIGDYCEGFYNTEDEDGIFIVEAAVSVEGDSDYEIPAEINGRAVLGIRRGAYRNLQAKAVYASECGDLTYLPNSAFVKCPNLKRVALYKSMLYVRGGAFAECPRLAEIDVVEEDREEWSAKRIPGRWGGEIFDDDGVLYVLDGARLAQYPPAREGNEYTIRPGTSEIEEHSFSYASGLEYVKFPMNGCAVVWNSFEYCRNLRSVSVWKDSWIGWHAFYGCVSLSEITVYGNSFIDASDDADLFYGAGAVKIVCDKNAVLTEEAAENGKMTMWNYAQQLIDQGVTGITLEQISTGWTYMKANEYRPDDPDFLRFADDEIFITGCAPLAGKTISTLPATIDGYRVVGVSQWAFENEENFAGSFVIPEGIRFIGWGAFSGTAISSISFPSTMEVIEQCVVLNCPNLTSMSVSPSNMIFYSDGKGLYEGRCDDHDNLMWAYAAANPATSYKVLPECRYIVCNVFDGASNLEEIVMPFTLLGIDGFAFHGCTGLTEVVIPSSLRRFEDGVFTGCTNLEDVYFYIGTTNLNLWEPGWEIYGEPDSNFFGTACTIHAYNGTRAAEWLDYMEVSCVKEDAESAICAGIWSDGGIFLTDFVMPESADGKIVIPEGITSIEIDDVRPAFSAYSGRSLEIILPSTLWAISSDVFREIDTEKFTFDFSRVEAAVEMYGYEDGIPDNLQQFPEDKTVVIDGLKYGLCGDQAMVLDWVDLEYPEGREVPFLAEEGRIVPYFTEEEYDELQEQLENGKNIVIPESVNVGGKNYTVTAVKDAALAYEEIWVRYETEESYDYDVIQRPLISVSIPDTVRYIGSAMLEWQVNLKALRLPENPVILGWSVTNNCLVETITGLTPYSPDNTNRYQLYVDEYGGQAVIDIEKSALVAYSKGHPAEAFVFPKGLRRIENAAFSSAVNLKILNIPEGIRVLEDYVIQHMLQLETLTLPSTLIEIYNEGNLVDECPKLRNITVADGNTAFKVVDGVLFTADGKKLIAYPGGLSEYADSYTIPDGTEEIRQNAFCSVDKEWDIYIPESVESVEDVFFGYAHTSVITKNDSLEIPEGIVDLDWRISDNNIKELVLPASLQTADINAFDTLLSLEMITINGGNNDYFMIDEYGALLSADKTILYKVPQSVDTYVIPDTVTRLGLAALYGCRKLTGELILPSGTAEIGDYALSDLYGISAFVIDGNEKYSTEDGVLYQTVDGEKTMLWYPIAKTDAVFKIPEDVDVLGWDCFCGNTSLKSITIPEGLKEIGNFSFSCCQSLRYVNIPNVTRIGIEAFCGCINLTKIEMPSVEFIDEGAFSFCEKLTAVMVGETVPLIHKTAFDGTPASLRLYYPANDDWSTAVPDGMFHSPWEEEENAGATVRAEVFAADDLMKTDATGISMVLAPDSAENAGEVSLAVKPADTAPEQAQTALSRADSDLVAVVSEVKSYDITPEVNGEAQSTLDAPAVVSIPLWEGYEGDGSDIKVLHEHSGVTQVMDDILYDPDANSIVLNMDKFSVITFAQVNYEDIDTHKEREYAEGEAVIDITLLVPDVKKLSQGEKIKLIVDASGCASFRLTAMNETYMNVGTLTEEGEYEITVLTQTKLSTSSQDLADLLGFSAKAFDSDGKQFENPTLQVTLTAAAAPAAPVLVGKTDTTVTLSAVTGCEYSSDNGLSWQDSNEFTGLSANTEYFFRQRTKAAGDLPASAKSGKLSVTTKASAGAAPDAAVTSRTAYGLTVTENGAWEYRLGDGEWQNSNVFTGLKPAADYRISVRVKETDAAMASEIKVLITATLSVVPAGDEGYTVDYISGVIRVKEGYELGRVSGGAFIPLSDTSLLPDTVYAIRKSGSPASDYVTFKTQSRPAAPSAFTVRQESVQNRKDASIDGITAKMEYKIGNGDWTDGTGSTVVNPENEQIRIRCKTTETAFYSEEAVITFTASTEKLTVTVTGGTDQKTAYGGKAVKPEEPAKDGYIFGGWYSDEDCTKAWSFVKDTVTDNMTLYPGWIDASEFPFADIAETTWSYGDIGYVWANGLMKGTSDASFEPKMNTSRAMIVTILWRLEGCPIVSYDMSFDDVKAEQWYADAIRWAQSVGIVKGCSTEKFNPEDDITREQAAAFFCRYAEFRGYDVTERAELDRFTDADEISPWAVNSMAWAKAVGLINGVSDTELDPDGPATREQTAAVLHRFCDAFTA